MPEIVDAEVFKSGVWNGDRYDDADLEDIVQSFPKLGYRPALKIGHEDNNGPACGYITRLRRVGSRLLATISDIPDDVYKLIKSRGFDRVSAEIYWNLERNGKIFRRALRAVALLGHTPPAVDLAPLRTVVHRQLGQLPAASFHAHTIPQRGKPMTTFSTYATVPHDRPDIALHNAIVEIMDAGKADTYEAARRRVFAEQPTLAARWARFSNKYA